MLARAGEFKQYFKKVLTIGTEPQKNESKE